ncbi:MAG: radical SAM family heme chaperone HemW [Bacteroidales bacterium]|nr:radical SAM family heme chaperone HemW [Bacteroidales bacterium]
MAGIYIHIPFCKQKCHYCNFFSLASVRNKTELLLSIGREIIERAAYLNKETVKTIYFGGGTPSLLAVHEIEDLISILHDNFIIDPDVEITLEANPDDLRVDYLALLRTSRVNRLSIGIQSFFDDDLIYLNRVHTAAHAREALSLAQDSGFEKITIDLIYGIPTLTNDKWLSNIQTFLETGINHLSAYALTVEQKTALYQLIAKGKLTPVDENQSASQFQLLMETLEKEGFIHYEISNFARPGHYSKHNSLYWLGGNYLGLGPSAHSYNGFSRQWNVSSLSDYIRLVGNSQEVAEKEILTIGQRYNEYVMTSIRTSWGCDLEHISNVFGESYKSYCLKQLGNYTFSGHIRNDGTRLILTQMGKLFADGIAAHLFMED